MGETGGTSFGSGLDAAGDLLSSAGEGLLRLDGGGRILALNDAYAQLVGQTQADLVGRLWTDFETEHAGSGTSYRAWHRHLGGGRVEVEVNIVPFLDGTLRLVRPIQGVMRPRECELETHLRRMNFLLNHQGEGCGLVDAEERFTYANPAAETIFGVPTGGLVGHALAEFLEPEQVVHVATKTKERRKGIRDSYELAIRRPDGEHRLLWITATQDTSETGEHQGTIGVFRDITERREAENQLRESEARLRALLEQAPLGIAMTRQGCFLYVNNFYARMHGCEEPKALFGRPIIDLVHPEDREAFLAFPQRLASGEAGLPTTTFRALRQDGSSFLLMATVGRLRLVDGPAFIGFMVDITEHQRAEVEREALIKELQEALDQVQTMQGLLPICSHCKKIRDDHGYWSQVETYISRHSAAEFTHSVCPDCLRVHFPEVAE